jgi:hypothetical protein
MRGFLRSTSPPLLGLAVLATLLHIASWWRILPPLRLSANPDQTLLSTKAELSRSPFPADIVLIGDSSCAADVDAPQLGKLLPGEPKVLNLGLIIGLGLDIYGEALSDFLTRSPNPNQARLIVLLVTPQLLSNEDLNQPYREWWHRLRRRDWQTLSDPPHSLIDAAAGVPLVRTHILPWLLHVPLTGKGAGFYGFSTDFESYLRAHQGSMVDPGLYLPPRQPAAREYFLAPALEAPSRRLHQVIPRNSKLAVALTPLPRSLVQPGYSTRRDALLNEWNAWLGADYVLTNLPAQLPDHLFATGGHLNQLGQRQFTTLLAETFSAIAPSRDPSVR